MVIDNLDRAERLGIIASADEWMTMHSLRNQMIHEYVENPLVLTNALQTGHAFVFSHCARLQKWVRNTNREDGLD